MKISRGIRVEGNKQGGGRGRGDDIGPAAEEEEKKEAEEEG